jgi:hypothetical protein
MASADDAGSGDNGDVGAFISGFFGVSGDEVDGFKGAAESGDGLKETADEDILAVGDAAFEAASARLAPR